MSNNFEIWNDRINLPKEFEWVSNRDKFLSAYKDIKDWYWEENLIQYSKIIVTKRENSRVDLERWYFWSVKNRLDFLLFDTIYPEFADIDQTLRTTSNTDVQRWFRQILVDLTNKLHHEITPTDRDFIKKEIKNIFPTVKAKKKDQFNDIFNSIYNQIKDHYWVIPNLATVQAHNINDVLFFPRKMEPLSGQEIENMEKIEISKNFSSMKDSIFSLMVNDEDVKSLIRISGKDEKYWKSYCGWIFNSFAEQIHILFWNGDWIPETFYKDQNIRDIILAYFKDLISWKETTEKKLVHMVQQKLLDNDDILAKYIDNNDEQIKKLEWKIGYDTTKTIELTAQEEKELNDANINNIPKEKLKDQYKIYKYLKQKEINNELDNDGKIILDALEAIFWENWQIKKRVRLYEIKNREFNLPDLWLLHRKDSVEYATWSMKNINPIAIVNNHDSIKKFVEWDNPSSDLSDDIRRNLLSELKGQHSNDSNFQESVKYLDDVWNIDRVKIRNDGITGTANLNNIERNEHTINDMIEKMAKKRNINELCCRKSIMTSCFRAISSFFDTVNNNWENFANEFEIGDLNNDITFDKGTWVISMQWTIWLNKNHIKLYYNTKTGTLEFDNFLAYNSQEKCYKIWKENWERDEIKIQLPTMREMEIGAKSINFNLIDKLTPNENIYEDMLWLAMRNSIWHHCFKWFMWSDMEVNKSFVKQFNEKNILKQDIINNIYSKFYSQNDIKKKLESCLVINEWNEPEQFKLIKLISDTIDDYDSSNKLLRFRNAINELDNILTNNPELVNKDPLLQYLFADNLNDDSDRTDTSNAIMSKENEDLAIDSSTTKNATYESDKKYKYNWNKTLSIKLFFDLLTESKWNIEIINLDWLEATLNTIKNTWKHLLDDKQSLLWKNYEKQKGKDFPDFSELETTQKETAQQLKHLEKDVKISNEFEPQIEQAYA